MAHLHQADKVETELQLTLLEVKHLSAVAVVDRAEAQEFQAQAGLAAEARERQE